MKAYKIEHAHKMLSDKYYAFKCNCCHDDEAKKFARWLLALNERVRWRSVKEKPKHGETVEVKINAATIIICNTVHDEGIVFSEIPSYLNSAGRVYEIEHVVGWRYPIDPRRTNERTQITN